MPSLAALLIQMAVPAFAPAGVRWEPLPGGSTERTEYDPASVRRDGDRVAVTLRSQTLENPQSEKYIAILIVDCPGRRYGIRASFAYTPAGAHLSTRETPEGEIQFMPMAEFDRGVLHGRVCPQG
jgi:hypothetical protein